MSESGLPLNGTNFPSYFACISQCVALPSASTPSAVYLTPSAPQASIFSVWLFGAGPGSNFDFARFIFHVPMLLSAAMTVMPSTNIDTTTTANAELNRRAMRAPFERVSWGPRLARKGLRGAAFEEIAGQVLQAGVDSDGGHDFPRPEF